MSKKSVSFVNEACSEIIKGLKSLGSKYSTWSVFEDWLKCCSISISNSVDYIHREQREKEYLEIIKKYTPDEQQQLVKLFAELTISLEKEFTEGGPTDLLGRVFHGLELHNKYHGQFFTPFHICEFMGQVALGDGGEAGNIVDSAITEKGYISVYEPCVGSGGMVLGFAKAMYKNKLNYCKQMVAYCCDIDIKCVHMAYLQLSLYGIPAVIIHGNSLTLEEWDRWYTPTYMVDMWPLKEKAPDINTMQAATKEKTPDKPTVTENDIPKSPDWVVKKNGQISFF